MVASPLARRLMLVTAIKLAALGLIYALCFGPRPEGPIDPAARIAGKLPPPALGGR